jgi:hypothetical protein
VVVAEVLLIVTQDNSFLLEECMEEEVLVGVLAVLAVVALAEPGVLLVLQALLRAVAEAVAVVAEFCPVLIL